MWPWEHVLFAYVAYSTYTHLAYRRSPTGGATVVLVLAAVLPDLVDKPLAWQFGVFDSGYAAAHSVLIAVPVSVLVYLLARRRGRRLDGIAFAYGYLFHLVGDVLPVWLTWRQPYVAHVLWPIGGHVRMRDHESLTAGVLHNLTIYVDRILALEPSPVLALQVGSVVVGLALWAYDGTPGLREPAGRIRRFVAARRASADR